MSARLNADGDLIIGAGNNQGGWGSVSVDGTTDGATLDVARQIIVGGPTSNSGNSLTILGGAVVSGDLSGEAQALNIDALAVGFEPTGNQNAPGDFVTIDGAGSQLNANGTIVVGVNSYGEIDVTNGGNLTGQSYPTGVSGLGQYAGSTGTINLDASTYNDGDLKVGDGGSGFLYAADGSAVTLGDDLVIAAQGGSFGEFPARRHK